MVWLCFLVLFIRVPINILCFAYIPYKIPWNLECTDKAAATLGKKKLDSDLAIEPIVSHIPFKTDDFQTV